MITGRREVGRNSVDLFSFIPFTVIVPAQSCKELMPCYGRVLSRHVVVPESDVELWNATV
jgi:hypothetical protein